MTGQRVKVAGDQPQRIQLSRRKGSKRPEGVINVDRRSIWGNPFKVGETIADDSPLWPYALSVIPTSGPFRGLTAITLYLPETAVAAYDRWLIEQPHLMVRARPDLGGRDLGCWCPIYPPGEPFRCHADYLLWLSNDMSEAA